MLDQGWQNYFHPEPLQGQYLAWKYQAFEHLTLLLACGVSAGTSHVNILSCVSNRHTGAVQWRLWLFWLHWWTQSAVFLYPPSLPCDFVAPSMKGWSLFPKPWNSATLWLLWPRECSKSNIIPFLSLGLRDPVWFGPFSWNPPAALWTKPRVEWESMWRRAESAPLSWTRDKAQPRPAKPRSWPQTHVRTPLNSPQTITYAQLARRLVIKNNCLPSFATEVLCGFVTQC